YFDKATGLLAKMERRALADAQKEVTEESCYSDYKDVDGVKVPMKIVVRHDGEQFLEMEVTEYGFLERIDDSAFARPGGGGRRKDEATPGAPAALCKYLWPARAGQPPEGKPSFSRSPWPTPGARLALRRAGPSRRRSRPGRWAPSSQRT